jgi:hypothetical protein
MLGKYGKVIIRVMMRILRLALPATVSLMLSGCAHEQAPSDLAMAQRTSGPPRGVLSPNRMKRAYWLSEKQIAITDDKGHYLGRVNALKGAETEHLFWTDISHVGYLRRDSRGDAMLAIHSITNDAPPQLATVGAPSFSPHNKDNVAFIARSPDGDSLWVNGKQVWPRSGYTHFRGDLVWSPNGTALTFVDLPGSGARLVVLVEFNDSNGDLTWPLPKDAIDPGLRLFWASDTKVVIGPSALTPKFAAGWERLD